MASRRLALRQALPPPPAVDGAAFGDGEQPGSRVVRDAGVAARSRAPRGALPGRDPRPTRSRRCGGSGPTTMRATRPPHRLDRATSVIASRASLMLLSVGPSCAGWQDSVVRWMHGEGTTRRSRRRASLELLRAEASDELSVVVDERLRAGEDPWEFMEDLPSVDELVVLHAARREHRRQRRIARPNAARHYRVLRQIALEYPPLTRGGVAPARRRQHAPPLGRGGACRRPLTRHPLAARHSCALASHSLSVGHSMSLKLVDPAHLERDPGTQRALAGPALGLFAAGRPRGSRSP